MESKTGNWYEVKVSYEKQTESGESKKTAEVYAVDAVSFGDAEKTVFEEVKQYVDGDVEILAISKAQYKEVFAKETAQGDEWYKAKLQILTVNERTGDEKKESVTYLVQGASLGDALSGLNDVMDKSALDYVSVGLAKTNIIDVIY